VGLGCSIPYAVRPHSDIPCSNCVPTHPGGFSCSRSTKLVTGVGILQSHPSTASRVQLLHRSGSGGMRVRDHATRSHSNSPMQQLCLYSSWWLCVQASALD
jgi:hypothetical protein